MRFEGKNNILVVKMRYIGDVLLNTPFLRAMRRAFPYSRISVLVNRGTEDVLVNNDDINDVITYDRSMGFFKQLAFVRDLRRRGFETVIDLSNSDRAAWLTRLSGARTRIGFKSNRDFRNRHMYNVLMDVPQEGKHQIDRHLDVAKGLGCKRPQRKMVLNLTDAEVAAGAGLTASAGEKYVVLHPGARRWYKSWPPERFAELGDGLKKLGLGVVICGGPGDLEAAGKIESAMKLKALNLAGKTTVRELSAVIKGAVLFVGNDSAPMHISYTVGTPTIALFGPTDYRGWHPIGADHMVFVKDVECSPCGHSSECTLGDDACMRLITVEEVLGGARMILDEKGLISRPLIGD
jgi:predicted lipopolysaccharide heptosyltransferase III